LAQLTFYLYYEYFMLCNVGICIHWGKIHALVGGVVRTPCTLRSALFIWRSAEKERHHSFFLHGQSMQRDGIIKALLVA